MIGNLKKQLLSHIMTELFAKLIKNKMNNNRSYTIEEKKLIPLI